MSHKINPYVVIDFETGGLNSSFAITEVAMVCVDGGTLNEIGRYESYVKPYLYQYDQKALDYTNTTMEKLTNEGQELSVVVKQMAEKLKEWLDKTSGTHTKKPILVGHNINKFDLFFVQQIFKETKTDISKYFEGAVDHFGHFQPSCLDTMNLCKLAFGGDISFTSFKLGLCVEKAGASISDAHKAMNDVIATKELLIKLVNKLRSDGESSTSSNKENTIRIRNSFHFEIEEPKN